MKEALLMLDLAGIAPKTVVLVGIVAQETSMNLGLSPAVRSALPAALDRVLVELRNLGVEGRPASRPPALWWERALV
jgi:hydrogenase maturation protease